MSILIKGMEMPTGCGRCSFSNGETGFCRAASEYIPMVNKPKFCPLIKGPPPGKLNEANLMLIKRGKIPFVLYQCSHCKHSGWFGANIPKYCVNCGAKFREQEA